MSSIHKRGRYWWYYWRDATGKQQAESLRTEYKEAAKILKDEKDKTLAMGAVGLPNPDASWSGAKRGFLAGYKEGKTREGHERTLQLFEDFASPEKVASVGYTKAKGFRDWLQNTPLERTGAPFKPASVNIHLRNIHCFFQEAVKSGVILKNPFSQVGEVPDVRRAPRYLSKDQVRDIMKEAVRSWPMIDLPILKVFLYTGLRISEVINLKWAAVDLDRELLYLRGSENWAPKDREEHAIGLHPELIKAFKSASRTSEYVFPGKAGRRRNKDSLRRRLNRLYKRAGITETGAHILRHSFATHAGLPPRVLQQVLGHSDLATTLRYQHVTPEQMREVKKISYLG